MSSHQGVSNIPLDSTSIAPFFKSYPDLKKYETDLLAIYRNYNFNYIWFDKKGIVVYGNSLYGKVKGIAGEGISSTFPYQQKIDDIFKENIKHAPKHPDADLLITSLYLYYADEVYKGIDDKTTTNIGWLLPRKKVPYTVLLDSIISDQKLQSDGSMMLFGQYYRLRDALKRYRSIEQTGGWIPIEPEVHRKSYKPSDTSAVILQIRDRLFVTGEIKQNNGSDIYDAELFDAIRTFQAHHGYQPDSLILPEHISTMNVPVGERIKTIVVNMERCRWISPEVFNADEFIAVNIPAYKMYLIQDDKLEFESPVVVGKILTKTVIFEGEMTYMVFSPYWNLPKNIIKDEVMPGIEKNENYLASHNMEWNNGKVRQLPGRNNSLGLVKFMFPNTNDIYLHDSPAKSLFEREERAMSHGCIRVAKARDLAITILKEDSTWTPERVDAAMHAGKETIYSLKNKIPVYIAYFTAWVDEQGQVNFYKDVYDRDARLAELLFYKQ